MRRFIAAALTLVLAVGSAGGQTFGKAKAAATPGPHGTRRALVVGISNYDSIPRLRYADRDARAFAAFLLSPKGFVDSANLRLLINDAATSWNIRSGLSWLKRASRPGDEAIIYFAGHGDVDNESGTNRGVMLTYNVRERRSEVAYYEGGLFTDQIEDFLVGISNGGKTSVLLITDACRSGSLLGGPTGRRITTEALVAPWTGVSKLVSSGAEGPSQEGAQWGSGHGIFTYYLIDALNGRADNGDGDVTLEEVARFIHDNVMGAPPRGVGKSQIPQRMGNMEWVIAWVQDTVRRTTLAAAASPAAAAAPDAAVQTSLDKFQQALAAGTLFDSAGAWEIYRQELASTSAAEDARSALVSALEEQANGAMSEYLSGGTTSGEARRAASALALAGDLVTEKSIRSRKFLARRLFFEGYAYAQKRDYQSARETLARSIALEPERAHAYNARGFAFLADVQLDSAWVAFTAARQRAPRLGYPLLGMALVALQVGEAQRALAMIDSGAALQGPQVPLQVARAIALMDLNRDADAATVFRVAMTLDPELKRADDVPEALSDMPKAVARLERLRALVR
jgi:tetratricopeptide (TPR) repeat protein